MNINIRKAAAGDYTSVLQIMNQVQKLHVEWRPDIYRPNDEILPKDFFTERVSAEEVYVAESEGEIIGVMEITFRHIETPAHVTRDVIFIDSMAVDEAYRGQGAGHAFFEKVKEVAREKNLDGIELQVNAKNKLAYEMYEKYGFTEKSINMELMNWK